MMRPVSREIRPSWGVLATALFLLATSAHAGVPRPCTAVVESARDDCAASPRALLARHQGLSSSLRALAINKQARSLEPDHIFKPRNDLSEWVFRLPVQWSTDPFKDRNWRMSLNSWHALDARYIAYSKSNDAKHLRAIVDAMRDWHRFHQVDKRPNKFGWYDMSSAFRADRLSKVLDWGSASTAITEDELLLLLEMAIDHVNYLADPKNLNPGNHGIFQVVSLARLCKITPFLTRCQEVQDWLVETTELLIAKQFGADGLHLEHSAGYHFFMLRTLRRLISEGVLPLSDTSRELVDNAVATTKWLRTPDGHVPPIGDTGSGKPASVGREAGTRFKLYPLGGLATVQSTTSALWFYGFHHSRVHKQDDDLAFYLWDKGEPLLIDAGLYGYISDWRRRYVRSRQAHNTVVIPGITRLMDREPFGSGIVSLAQTGDAYSAHGSVDYGEGVDFERVLRFVPGKELVVSDHVRGLQGPVEINFLIGPAFDKVSETDSEVSFKSGSNRLIVTSESGCTPTTYRGLDQPDMRRGWYSPSYGKLSPTWSVSFKCLAGRPLITTISY